MPPPDVLRKKRQRSLDGTAPADEHVGEEQPALSASANAAGAAPPSPRSDAGSSEAGSSDAGSSSSGISWRSGSTGGSSLPHHLSGMAATDILDSYMRELLHNTIPCLGAPPLGVGLVRWGRQPVRHTSRAGWAPAGRTTPGPCLLCCLLCPPSCFAQQLLCPPARPPALQMPCWACTATRRPSVRRGCCPRTGWARRGWSRWCALAAAESCRKLTPALPGGFQGALGPVHTSSSEGRLPSVPNPAAKPIGTRTATAGPRPDPLLPPRCPQVRRGFAGHCMVQLIFGLELHRAPQHALAATMAHLADILAGGSHPAHIMWSFVVRR